MMSGKLVQVLAMHHRVHGQRQIKLARPFRNLDLLAMRVLEAGDAIGDAGLVALEADLHMAEAGVGKIGKFLARQQAPRR